MEPWKIGKLQVHPQRPYLMTGSQPFFWLGDTAWLMIHRLTKEEIILYLRNRQEKGFNVIQTTLLQKEPGLNAYGAYAFEDMDFAKPILSGENSYWEIVDFTVRTAQELGMFIGLLPHWGTFSRKVPLESMEVYVRFLADRYKDAPNVFWILGGDIRGNENFDYWERMGTIFRTLNPDKLLCFHPFGRTTSIDFFPKSRWLDLHMFQSGHRRYDQVTLKTWDDNAQDGYCFGEDNWRYVERVHRMTKEKNGKSMPVLDAEPSYENIPQGLHSGAEPKWRDADVRRYSYWSVLAGACGFTYGHNAVMQMWDSKETSGSYDCWETWKEAIHHPGGDSMKHMASLMRSVDFVNGNPAQELLADEEGTRYERISIFSGGDFLIAYSCGRRQFTLKGGFLHGEFSVHWMNPLTGVMSYAGRVGMEEAQTFVTPVKEYMPNKDWVLVLKRP